jgi:ElaB/YqjD/DUF883 family membrane-anchored ribosome-binding protein
MSTDPDPLKFIGTQSQETMNMEAALTSQAVRSEHDIDRATEQLADQPDSARSKVADAGSRSNHAVNWAVDKAKDAAQAVADQVHTAVESYTRDDPIRAILIAAGTGALLMGLVAMMARSGARSVRRRVQG